MGKQYDDDEVEIDLRAIFLELKKKLWMILAAVVAGGCIGGLYSAVVLTPTYTSTSMMSVSYTHLLQFSFFPPGKRC